MASKRVVLHKTGKLEYRTEWNGHLYEIWKEDRQQEVWCITCDGDSRDGSYWLRDIRGSIEAGDLEEA